MGRRSAYVDVLTVLDVWNVEMFPAECRGRIVLDVGAHKGYFGAWALSQGAALVVSCEPERSNFARLSRAYPLVKHTVQRRIATDQKVGGSTPSRRASRCAQQGKRSRARRRQARAHPRPG